MKPFKLRYIIAFLLIAITSVIVNLLHHESQYDNTAAIEAIHKVPLRLASWTGRDVKLDENVYEILDTRAILHRAYTSKEGDSVFLSIVHYADTKVDFHAPEGCLGGSGIEAEKKIKSITVSSLEGSKTFDVAEIITSNNDSKTLVYYFYKVGSFSGQDYIKMRINVALNKLTKGNSSGSLVRLSTQINADDTEDARTILHRFLSQLYPVLEEIL